MTNLTSLIQALREAKEGSLVLDKAILRVLGYSWRGMDYWRDDRTIWRGRSDLSQSLDAITALIEREMPGCCWGVSAMANFSNANIILADTGTFSGSHDTPALALCIAFLSALQAIGGANG